MQSAKAATRPAAAGVKNAVTLCALFGLFITLGSFHVLANDEAAKVAPRGDLRAIGGSGPDDESAKTTSAEIDALVRQLGASSYEERRDATARLLAVDPDSAMDLKKALTQGLASKDPEISARCQSILDELAARSKASSDARSSLRRSAPLDEDHLEILRRTFEGLPFRVELGFGGPGLGGPATPDALLREMAEMDRRLGQIHRDLFRSSHPFPAPEPGQGLDRLLDEIQKRLGSGRDGDGTTTWRREVWRNGEKIVDESGGGTFGTDARLGIGVEPLGQALRIHLGLEREGVLVRRVLENGVGHRGGIEAFDIIVKIGETVVHGFDELAATTAELAEKKTVPVEVIRRGKKQILEMVLD